MAEAYRFSPASTLPTPSSVPLKAKSRRPPSSGSSRSRKVRGHDTLKFTPLSSSAPANRTAPAMSLSPLSSMLATPLHPQQAWDLSQGNTVSDLGSTLPGPGAVATPAECSRSRAPAVVHKERVYVFGGSGLPDQFSGGRLRSDLVCLNPSTGTWYKLHCSGMSFPRPRMHHCAVVKDGKLVIHGGVDASGTVLNDMWAVSLRAGTHHWRKVAVRTNTDQPLPWCPGLFSHAAAIDPAMNSMVVQGGRSGMSSSSLFHVFRFTSQEWEVVQTRNEGPLIHNHSLEVVNTLVFAYGGNTYSQGDHEARNLLLFVLNMETWVWRTLDFTFRTAEVKTDFTHTPLLLAIVRQTNQLWFYGRTGAHVATLPEATSLFGNGLDDGDALSLAFHPYGKCPAMPQHRSHACVAVVGRTIWLVFGEEEERSTLHPSHALPSEPLHARLPPSLAVLLSEDYFTSRKCYADVNAFAIDLCEWMAIEPGQAYTFSVTEEPKPVPPPTATSPPPSDLLQSSGKTRKKKAEGGGTAGMVSRLLREKYHFDKAHRELVRQGVGTPDMKQYETLLDSLIEKYLKKDSEGVQKRKQGRKRKELQRARQQDAYAAEVGTDPSRWTDSPAPSTYGKNRLLRRSVELTPPMYSVYNNTDLSSPRHVREGKAATLIQAFCRKLMAKMEATRRRAARARGGAPSRRVAQPAESVVYSLEEEEAAEEIQRVYRGHQGRAKALQKKEENEAAVRIQALQRGRVARAKAARERAATKIQKAERGRRGRVAAKEERRRERAAVDIQRVVRGRRGRVEARKEKEREKAATKIQSLQRGRKGRRTARTAKERDLASRQIQRVVRGRLARNEARARREAEEKRLREEVARYEAAETIQRRVRGMQARRKAKKLQEEVAHWEREEVKVYNAAETIQRCVRGLLARKAAQLRRKELAEQESDEMRRDEAATHIQRVVRGRHARKEAKRTQNQRAAVSIQRAERGRRARKEADIRKKAILKIQTFTRGVLARGKVKQLRTEHRAATRIQAVHRGGVSRQKIRASRAKGRRRSSHFAGMESNGPNALHLMMYLENQPDLTSLLLVARNVPESHPRRISRQMSRRLSTRRSTMRRQSTQLSRARSGRRVQASAAARHPFPGLHTVCTVAHEDGKDGYLLHLLKQAQEEGERGVDEFGEEEEEYEEIETSEDGDPFAEFWHQVQKDCDHESDGEEGDGHVWKAPVAYLAQTAPEGLTALSTLASLPEVQGAERWEAATRIQKWYRRSRREAPEPGKDKAALTIQCSYRRMLARKEAASLRHCHTNEDEVEAARCIQAVVREHQIRKHRREAEARDAAATRIQTNVRRHQAQKRRATKSPPGDPQQLLALQLAQEREAAATQIQALQRGRVARKAVKAKREALKPTPQPAAAGTRPQLYNEEEERKARASQIKAMQSPEEVAAATKIQAFHRGCHGRTAARKRKEQKAGTREAASPPNATIKKGAGDEVRAHDEEPEAHGAEMEVHEEEKAREEARAHAALSEDAAATRIQALQRGRRDRERVAVMKADRRRRIVEEDAALRIQAAERGRVGRAKAARLREERRRGAETAAQRGESQTKSEASRAQEREAAATKIQAVQRGRAARARTAALRSGKDNERGSCAATKIQAVQRGRVARKEAERRREAHVHAESVYEQEREHAARMIQKRVKGHLARRHYVELRENRKRQQANTGEEELQQERDAAAMQIQRVTRGRKARTRVATLRRERDMEKAYHEARAREQELEMMHGAEEGVLSPHAAATRIQALHRGRAGRREVAERRHRLAEHLQSMDSSAQGQEVHAAAARIQGAVRGRRDRKLVAELRATRSAS